MAIRQTNQEAILTDVRSNTGAAIRPSASILIDDVATHTGSFFAVTALEDAELDSANSITNITDIANFVIPKGVTIYGNFSAIAIDSGKVIAYTL